MTQLEKILIRDQEGDIKAAREILHEMTERTLDGEDPEEILYEFGYEPDYVFDILDHCI